MSKALVILGMHRSGTSAIAGSLEDCGVYLGDVNSCSPDNLKGNRELREVITLNEDLLKSAGGSWFSPPEKITWSPLHKVTRDLIVNKFASKSLWGFKDPRTLLVLDGWLQAIPNAELICVFRHPFLVAESLYQRNSISHTKGLALWITYNRVLKWHLERNERFTIIEFSHCAETYKNQLDSLVNRLGLSPQRSGFYNPELKQSSVADLSCKENAKEAMSLYQNLQNTVFNKAA